MSLTESEKHEIIEKQIELYHARLKQLEDRRTETLKRKAECNFIAEVTGCKPSCFDRALLSLEEEIQETEKGLECWVNYAMNHPELQ